MARGNPDFYGQSVYNRKGGARLVSDSVAVVGAATVRVVDLAGKGILYAGVGYCWGGIDQTLGRFTLTVDGVVVSSSSFLTLLRYGWVNQDDSVLYLRSYDVETQYFAIALSGELTFDVTVLLDYVEVNGDALTAGGALAYSNIQ